MHQLITQLLMAHFSAAELELEFHLVPSIEELLGVTHLDHIIVGIDVHAELDFFEFGSRRTPIFILLGKIIAVFPKIDDFANGWIGCGRYFYEVKPKRLSSSQGVLQLHDT